MFYRGSDIRSLNSDEFLNNAIDGSAYPVVDVDFPEDESVADYKYQDTSNFLRYIEDSREVAITGGLTDTLPAAIKFTQQAFPPGLVLIMDETNIPADVEPIDYSIDWFDAHPGVLAHVTTLRDGELREDGRISALMGVDGESMTVDEWRRSEIENEATASRYTTEREVVAFGDEIWLDDSVTSMAMYLGTTGVSPYTIKNALKEVPGYRSSLGTIKNADTREVVAGAEEYRKQAEALYDVIEPLIDFGGAPMYLVAVDSHNDVRAKDGRIEPDNFRFVYNGRGFDTSYERNSHLLGNV